MAALKMSRHRPKPHRHITGTRPPQIAHTATTTFDGPGRRSLPAAIAGLVFVAAFLERWWFSSAWHEAGSLTSVFYYGDAPRLVDYAIAIAQGRTFDNGIPFHPPGWPLVLAAFLKLFGAGAADFVVPVAAVKLLLAGISAASVAVATLVAYEIAGPIGMLGVALLGPFHFGHIVEGTVADTEALYGMCVILAVYATLRATSGDARHRTAWTVVGGLIAGYAMLVRAEFIACAVLLGAAFVIARREGWRVQVGLFAVLYGLVLVPTTVWHWRSLGAFNASHVGRVAGPLPQFAPVTSYGPFNFAMANHENSDGGPNRDHPMFDLCNPETEGRLDVGQLDLACPAVFDLYVHGYRIGATWIVTHPGDALALIGRKLAMASGFLAHGYLADDFGAGVTGTRRRVDLVDPDTRALLWIHLALTALGVWALRRRTLPLVVVLAPIVAFVASTILFYGYVRLGTSYLPAIWVLQATGIAGMVGKSGSHKAQVPSPKSAVASRKSEGANPESGVAIHDPGVRRSVLVAAVALMLVLLAIDGIRVSTARQVTLDGPRTDAGVLVQDETVRVERAGE